MRDWQSALAQKISDEGQSVNQQLATLNPSDAMSSVKVHSERKLLAMTPKALDVLDAGMDAGQTKDRVAAASKVLDLSPATRIQTTFGSEQSIPIEALTTILQGMASMFRGASVQFAKEPESSRVAEGVTSQAVEEPAITILHDNVEEALCETAPDPKRADRRPVAPLTRRSALRSDVAVLDDGVQEEEVVPEPSAKGSRRSQQHQKKHQSRALARGAKK
jgi:hypothetical protein